MIKPDTKGIFMNAFLELCEEKRIDKITVRDVLERTGAARQTFYNHFKDKYDLMNYVYRRKTEEIFPKYGTSLDIDSCILLAYIHFKEHKSYYMHIVGMEGQNDLKHYLFENTRDFYISKIRDNYGDEVLDDLLMFCIESTCYGAANMCAQWIAGGMKGTAEEMASRIVFTIHPMVKQYLT